MKERREGRQSVKRAREEKADTNAGVNVILASENVKLAESITWTKPKATKKQRTEEQQSDGSDAVTGDAATTAAIPTIDVVLTDECEADAAPSSPTAALALISSSTLSSTAADVVHRTRAALEGYVAACPAANPSTGSFAQSTPSRLRRTASPAYIDALHVLGPLLAQQQYAAALVQLDTVAALLPCHRTQAEYHVLRAFTVEKLQRPDEEVCGVYSAAVECAAQPASGLLEGFQSFERRRSERPGQHAAQGTAAAASAVPATPMSRLLHKYRSARPSLAGLTPAVAATAAAAVPPATPRSALLRSKLLDGERNDGESAVTAPTPRSAQLRRLKLTPEFQPAPPADPRTAALDTPQPQPHQHDELVGTPCAQAGEGVAMEEQSTPQLARNLLDDMQAAEELATPPMDARTPCDKLSPLAPLPLSICSPVAAKEAAHTEAEKEERAADAEAEAEAEAATETDTSLATPEAPAGLFDEDEYIPGLSTPFPSFSYAEPIAIAAPLASSHPALSLSASQRAVHPPPSPPSVGVSSEHFVSPVRRSTRRMTSGAAQAEAQHSAAAIPESAHTPIEGSHRSRSGSRRKAVAAPTEQSALAITVDAAPATSEAQQAAVRPAPRKGTPMHARRATTHALLPPPPIAQPNLIVLQPIRSPHHAATSASALSGSAAPLGSALSAAPFVSPVRRSARHSVDWTGTAHETVARLEAGVVSLRPNASLGDRQQEWRVQAEKDRAAMPPPPPRQPRRSALPGAVTAAAPPVERQTVEAEAVAAPAPAGRFEGGKRHATPRPSGTRRSSRLIAREDDVEEGEAGLERTTRVAVARRRSQRFD